MGWRVLTLGYKGGADVQMCYFSKYHPFDMGKTNKQTNKRKRKQNNPDTWFCSGVKRPVAKNCLKFAKIKFI